MGSAVAFDSLLAAVPFLILLLVGLTFLVRFTAQTPQDEIAELFRRFLPRRADGSDPFAWVAHFLAGIARSRGSISYVAIPAFLWFSTRLFASVRTALSRIYHSVMPPPARVHPLLALLRGKARDMVMVLVTLVLLLINVAATAVLAVAQARGTSLAPQFGFLLTGLGRLFGEFVPLLMSWVLFFLLYRFSTVRRPSRRSAAYGSLFAALAFELAKRLYGYYIQHAATVQGLSVADNLGAVFLFVLWVYYTGVVLLLGAVVSVLLDRSPPPAVALPPDPSAPAIP